MSFSSCRVSAGFTLDDVSREFGVPLITVRNWEEGRADASLRYTGIDSHEGLTHVGGYDTVVAKELEPTPAI